MVVLFHELGHGIHDVVSKTRYSHFHGPDSVPVDFGELPSQMLEEWCWTPSQLKVLGLHYSYLNPDMHEIWKASHMNISQPEKYLPDDMIGRLLQARRLTFGPLFYLDQLQRGMFDMAIHQLSSIEEAESLDLAALWNKLHKDVRLIDGPETLGEGYSWGHGFTTFTHLMIDDYTAGYYAYLLWVTIEDL
jgi:metallopeptidase MepB